MMRIVLRPTIIILCLFFLSISSKQIFAAESFLQSRENSCGPAALRIILHHLGMDISEDEIAQKAGMTKAGTSLFGLKQAVESLGLTARGERWNWVALKKMGPTPVIAFVNGDHYVVVEKALSGKVLLFDPAMGQTEVSERAFRSAWRGEVLVLGTSSHFKEAVKKGGRT